MNIYDLSSAKSYALRLIKFRVRSEQEIRQKLQLKDYEASVIDETIAFLRSKKFLDDALFAKLWVQSRLKRPFGFRRLRYELKNKGVASGIIEAAIEAAKEEVDEAALVNEIVSRKIKTMAKLPQEKIKARLYGLLIRRGFSQDVIMEVLEKQCQSVKMSECQG